MLRSFVHTDHYNWLASLSLAEFACNNNVHSSIGHSLFVTNYCFDLRTPYNLIDPPIDMIPQQNNDNILQRLMTVHNLIVEQLKYQRKFRNLTRIEISLLRNLMLVKELCLAHEI